ncbi:MAG: glycosyltransferase family 2 protein [Patescibacteria group bacterium]
MKLAIQVITHHSSKHLAPLLESLKAQTFQEFEMWFLDNSENRDEAELSRAQVVSSGLRHTFIVNETNTGFAGGHQAMFLSHEAPFVMLLNDDATLAPEYLERVMRRIESDPKIGSITGLVLRSDGVTIDTTGLEYKCLAQIVDRFAGCQMSNVRSQMYSEEVFGVSGAIGLYRRSAVEKAGGLFGPKWFMYKEDVDLALRLRNAGFVSWFEPEAIAWHARGVKAGSSHAKRPVILRKSSYVNQWRVYRRHWKGTSFGDKLRSIGFELLRSAHLLIMAPKIFFEAWRELLSSVF